MTRDDIIRMAREAGTLPWDWKYAEGSVAALERFADLVAAAEREGCAKVCEERIGYWQLGDNKRDEDEQCAIAIRNRGKHDKR